MKNLNNIEIDYSDNFTELEKIMVNGVEIYGVKNLKVDYNPCSVSLVKIEFYINELNICNLDKDLYSNY